MKKGEKRGKKGKKGEKSGVYPLFSKLRPIAMKLIPSFSARSLVSGAILLFSLSQAVPEIQNLGQVT